MPTFIIFKNGAKVYEVRGDVQSAKDEFSKHFWTTLRQQLKSLVKLVSIITENFYINTGFLVYWLLTFSFI